ncbi:MAG: M23 family metallopeptidase [Bacteroidia bacterium]|nr:M23 family metallopeptidase [Bacteroidia bacterium]
MLLNWFEWDEKNLTFERKALRISMVWEWARPSLIWGTVGGILLAAAAYPLWEHYFLYRASKEHEKLLRQKQQIIEDIASQDWRLHYFYERAQKLYRPILGLSPLTSAEWEGNMGGAPIQPQERPLYRAKLLHTEFLKMSSLLQEQSARLAYLPCIIPVNGVITSRFGMRRDPFHGGPQMHMGIDISAPYGYPVRAAATGKVRFAGWDYGGYGLQVEIDHKNDIITKYAHLSRIAVQVGETVQRGQIIGFVGSTGYSIAPHLHYEVIERGLKVNPEKYILLP